MRSSPILALCILTFVGPVAGPFAVPAEAAPSVPLPDLCIAPEDIRCSIYQGVVNTTARGTPVNIEVTVRNLGPGSSDSANASFFIDERPAASATWNTPLSAVAPDNCATVGIIWNTTSAGIGRHVIRVEARDAQGDANAANNNASKDFTIISVPKLKLDSDRSNTLLVTAVVDLGVEMSVRLSTGIDTNWSANCYPDLMVFNSSGIRPFNLTVIFPQGTLNSVFGNVRVEAHGYGEGFDVFVNISAIMSVDPYYRFTLETDDPAKEIPPGGEAVFTVMLTNAGNAVDSFELKISNLKELAAKKWTVVLSANTIPKVQPGEYKPFRITARSPHDWTIWKSEPSVIIINATSQNAKDFQKVVSQTIILHVNRRGFDPPSVAAIALVLSVLVAALVVIVRRRRKKRA
mgnify:CR=1 FL=1